MRRHRPEEAVAIIEIVDPFAVAEQVGLGDLDLDDGQAALGVDRHQVGAAAVGQRHFADREQSWRQNSRVTPRATSAAIGGASVKQGESGSVAIAHSIERNGNAAKRKAGEPSPARRPPAFERS